MRTHRTCLGLLLGATLSAHAQAPQIDPQLRAFSQYISDVANLDGMFHGVLDYCTAYVEPLIIEQARTAWKATNGAYVDALDPAIEKFVRARVEAERQVSASQTLKANTQGWFQKAHDGSKLLERVKSADNKGDVCANMLGSFGSASFDLRTMSPEDYAYFERNLKP